MMNEQTVVNAARKMFGGRAGGRVRVGIGDDAAVVRIGRTDVVLTIDSVVEGVDFDFRYFTWTDVGFKAVSAAVSDLYACGARPCAILVSVGLPAGTRASDTRALMSGLRDAARVYGAKIVGGDTSASPRLFVDVCAVGEIAGSFKSRSGAKLGDWIFLSGPVGASRAALGLFQKKLRVSPALRGAHCRPIAAASDGIRLAREPRVTAMMDVSDGLLIDLARMCAASRVSAGIFPSRVPVLQATRDAFRRLRRDPVQEAMVGGEDYVLLFCVRPPVPDGLAGRYSCIGQILPRRRGVQTPLYNMERRSGIRHPAGIMVKGFLHRF